MDRKHTNISTIWLCLILVTLTTTGLLARIHPHPIEVLPQVIDNLTSSTSLPTTSESNAAPEPSKAAPTYRRPTLSMPYFSFARLLRPGS